MTKSIKVQITTIPELKELITAIILFSLCALFLFYVANYKPKASVNIENVELVGQSTNATSISKINA